MQSSDECVIERVCGYFPLLLLLLPAPAPCSLLLSFRFFSFPSVHWVHWCIVRCPVVFYFSFLCPIDWRGTGKQGVVCLSNNCLPPNQHCILLGANFLSLLLSFPLQLMTTGCPWERPNKGQLDFVIPKNPFLLPPLLSFLSFSPSLFSLLLIFFIPTFTFPSFLFLFFSLPTLTLTLPRAYYPLQIFTRQLTYSHTPPSLPPILTKHPS